MPQTKLATVNQYGNNREKVWTNERFDSIGSVTLLRFGSALAPSAMIVIVEREEQMYPCKEVGRLLPFLVQSFSKIAFLWMIGQSKT
jgi:hypothetical protein